MNTVTGAPHGNPPLGLKLSEGLGLMPARWYCVDSMGLATLCASEADALMMADACAADYPRGAPYHAVQLVDAVTVAMLREALTELRDRIKAHPAYANLTEEEEIETGGDTAELSYLARVADAALGA